MDIILPLIWHRLISCILIHYSRKTIRYIQFPYSSLGFKSKLSLVKSYESAPHVSYSEVTILFSWRSLYVYAPIAVRSVIIIIIIAVTVMTIGRYTYYLWGTFKCNSNAFERHNNIILAICFWVERSAIIPV